MITVKEKIRLIEACFGSAKLTADNKNAVVFCPSCKAHGKDKRKWRTRVLDEACQAHIVRHMASDHFKTNCVPIIIFNESHWYSKLLMVKWLPSKHNHFTHACFPHITDCGKEKKKARNNV